MGKIEVLDCTLRDGGYCNQWEFGFQNIKTIINGLVEANIDIIECGFLTNLILSNKNISRYASIEDISCVIPDNRKNKLFVCMIDYGEYCADDLPEYDGTSVDGIRVAFHKKDWQKALELCAAIKEKGYKEFVQAMVSVNYTDKEFLDLVAQCNKIAPYAFYIVDSFGGMKRQELMRLFYMLEHNSDSSIMIGLHSHNNMQSAYSNAQLLIEIKGSRDILVDTSVYGMGRGAGNLNTELFVEYLNDNVEHKYQLKPLLIIIDEILNDFYSQNNWGYSLPNYLSARNNTHPNYADYLDKKKTLTIENMGEIFAMIDDTKRMGFDKSYIEDLYQKYMSSRSAIKTNLEELKENLRGKKVIIIAPGKSLLSEREKVIAAASKKDVISISINFDYAECQTDYIFLSNLRRLKSIDTDKLKKCVVTSNIPVIDAYTQIPYTELLNDVEPVMDNSGLMLIKFLIKSEVSEIYVAGMDGYAVNPDDNFVDSKMNFYLKKTEYESMNAGIETVLREFIKEINITFVTTPKYISGAMLRL